MPYCRHFDADVPVGTCSLCSSPVRSGVYRSGQVASVFFDVGTVELECPYNEDFLVELKSRLPSHARTWDPDRYVWIISGEWWDAAQAIVEEYFDLSD